MWCDTTSSIQTSDSLFPLNIYTDIYNKYRTVFGGTTNILSLADVLVYKVASMLEKAQKKAKRNIILLFLALDLM